MKIGGFLLVVGLASAAVAQAEPSPASVPALAPLLKAGVEARLLERIGDLDAWAVLSMGKAGVIYTTADGRFLVEGSVFGGEDARNMTLAHQQRAIAMVSGGSAVLPPPGPQAIAVGPTGAASAAKLVEVRPATPEALYRALAEAPGVDFTVPGRPTLLLVVDPSCPHCKAMWGDLRPYLQRREIGVRLVVAATPGSDAENQAAHLLALGSKDEAWAAWERIVTGTAGAAGSTAVSPTAFEDGKAKVAQNVELYLALRLPGTPFAVYRSGSEVRVLAGRPDNIAAIVAELKR